LDGQLIVTQQGISWIVRKVINYADLELQYVKVPPAEGSEAHRFTVKQTVRPGGFDFDNEYIVDGAKRTNTLPIFGTVTVHCSYVGYNDLTQEQVFDRQIDSGEDEGYAAMIEVVHNESKGWVATNVWAFEVIDGGRRLCKYNTTSNGGNTTKALVVHDYLGPPLS
jgi:hypothetical protein